MMTLNEIQVNEKFNKGIWELHATNHHHEKSATYDRYDRVIRVKENPSGDPRHLIELLNELDKYCDGDYKVACHFDNALFYRKRTMGNTFEVLLEKPAWKLLPNFNRYLNAEDLHDSDLYEKDEDGTSTYDRICQEIEEDLNWDISNLAPLWWQSEESVANLTAKELEDLLWEAEELQSYTQLTSDRFEDEKALANVEEMQTVLERTFIPLELGLEARINQLYDDLESPRRLSKDAFEHHVNQLMTMMKGLKVSS